MKLIIQIPCFNEAQTLPAVVRDLPKSLPGVDVLEYLVIDDGSTDNTEAVARSLGIHHIIKVSTTNRRWLGRAFKAGIDYALAHQADIVVNTDGDNQYAGSQIGTLITPLLNGTADLVIGDRNPGALREFSVGKRLLQRLGNWIIGLTTGIDTRDAVSGFRAYTREALLKLHVITDYTYTLDTLIQAHKKGLTVVWTPITTNPKTRESRLIRNLGEKVLYSARTIIQLATLYNPERIFFVLSMLFGIPGFVLLLRFFYYYFVIPEESRGHVQSVVVGGVGIIIAAQMLGLSVLAHMHSTNRRLIDELLTRIRRLSTEKEQTEP